MKVRHFVDKFHSMCVADGTLLPDSLTSIITYISVKINCAEQW